MPRILRRSLIALAIGLPLAVVLAAGTLWGALRGSLPRLDGEFATTGITAPVRIARDDLGVVDIHATDRGDAAFALGFVHAQDRFFQMDLQRRAAAGELAALFGPVALERDRDTRRHRFRRRARAKISAMPPADRRIVDAYTAGVNAGLDDLQVRPFEYLALRQAPQPWRAEDTVLVLYSMFLDLAYSTVTTELNAAVVADLFGAPLAALLLPRANRWEAPLAGDGPPLPVIPDPADADLRDWTFDGMSYDEYRSSPHQDQAGSNNWAVAGMRTADGRALLANDMHLGLSLPNTWYRARIGFQVGGTTHEVVGATLPGTPAVVVGSNGRVAWGFTNSYGDWSDLVRVGGDSVRYRTPDGWKNFERDREIIEVAGADPDTLWIESTVWGPVWATDPDGNRLALRWTAHDPEAANFRLLDLETARDVDEALAVATTLGIPGQNLVCADADGRVGWALAARIPRRVGYDGRLPVSWASGRHRWDGYLDPAEQPRLADPVDGLVWTANNRVVSGEALAQIGDGGYALGARARQIRDTLRSMAEPDERAMLELQLDDRALFLGEWRDFLLSVLARHEASLDTPQRRFLTKVRDDWEGRASTGSVSYRLVRNAVYECIDVVYQPFTRVCAAAWPGFDARYLPYRHAVAWLVLHERPENLLPPWLADWDDAVLRAVRTTMDAVEADPEPLAGYTWGRQNEVSVAHPFAALVPALRRWLATAPVPLPGDAFMPRVQGPHHGASERMAVSPGHEEDGIFHMPGGQSGHPLSPWFLAGHEAWEEGRPTPLLPGAATHRLRLTPD